MVPAPVAARALASARARLLLLQRLLLVFEANLGEDGR